mmetsp:Transcript_1948/g.2986  ORF Transcript_1948/g.2986 Transcript_1948/m.2986 type:complete len:308 (-) Transcript_1948:70-993(-)
MESVMACLALCFSTWFFPSLAHQVVIDASVGKLESVPDKKEEAYQIPWQVIMTGKEETIDALPDHLKKNVKRTQALNPDMTFRYLSDVDCRKYVRRHFDDELADIYINEKAPQFRGDICRAAVLLNEGGFYADLDLQPTVPFQELVDESTKFMSVFTEDGAILNALMATVPKSPILNNTIREFHDWYKGGRRIKQSEGEWMGTVTLKRGLKSFMRNSCPDLDLDAEREAAHSQWTCASQGIRFYQEDKLNCGGRSFLRRSDKAECPPEREVSDFQGAHYGIFVQGGPRRIVAWPRMASCDKWWCGTR